MWHVTARWMHRTMPAVWKHDEVSCTWHGLCSMVVRWSSFELFRAVCSRLSEICSRLSEIYSDHDQTIVSRNLRIHHVKLWMTERTSRTTVSLSLKKCLVHQEYLDPILDMVEAVTWASTNMMWTVNLVILKFIERGLDPPPLCRDLFMDCYTHSCKPKPRNTTNNIQAETDYYKLAVEGIKRKRFHDMPDNQDVEKKRKISLYTPEEATAMHNIPLSPRSITAAWKTSYKNVIAREEKFQSKGLWSEILKEVTDELGSLSHTTSWRPHPKQLNGESDHMEQLVKSELVPNSITYISETYRARRRFY